MEMGNEIRQSITMDGKPLTLIGKQIKVGQAAPDFSVIDSELNEITLNNFNFQGKIKIITTFVSLDTPVCNSQVKEFNKKAAQLSSKVVILGISKDLPFAQKRFCTMNEIKNIFVLSDYKDSSFGNNYGLIIKELNLLGRATIIIDADNIIRFIDIVPEISNEPDYDKVLKQLQEIVNP